VITVFTNEANGRRVSSDDRKAAFYATNVSVHIMEKEFHAEDIKPIAIELFKVAQPLMVLSKIDDVSNFVGYHRFYFRSTLNEDVEYFLLTTNEVEDNAFDSVSLGEHFTILKGYRDILDELEESSPVNHERESVHSPPKYIYYDIKTMDLSLCPFMYLHLCNQVDGWSEDYVNQHFCSLDRDRIRYWKDYLQSRMLEVSGAAS
jgi:hypothetical protein